MNHKLSLDEAYHQYLTEQQLQSKQANNVNAEVDDLRKKFEGFEAQQKKLAEENKKLKTDLETSRVDLNTSQANLTKYLSECEKLKSEKQKIQQELDASRADLDTSRSTIDQLKKEILNLSQAVRGSNVNHSKASTHSENSSQRKTIFTPEKEAGHINSIKNVFEGKNEFFKVIDLFVKFGRVNRNNPEQASSVTLADKIIFNLLKANGPKMGEVITETIKDQNLSAELSVIVEQSQSSNVSTSYDNLHPKIIYDSLRQLYFKGYYLERVETSDEKFKFFDDLYFPYSSKAAAEQPQSTNIAQNHL